MLGYDHLILYLSAQLKPNGELDFRPTAEFPALQYLDSIDPGSAADRAGLKAGDFILEVSGCSMFKSTVQSRKAYLLGIVALMKK